MEIGTVNAFSGPETSSVFIYNEGEMYPTSVGGRFRLNQAVNISPALIYRCCVSVVIKYAYVLQRKTLLHLKRVKIGTHQCVILANTLF